MRRSVSTPTLSKSKSIVIPRNVSVPVSLYTVMTEVFTELQVESITQTPAYLAGMCGGANHTFPMDLLDATVSQMSAIKDIGACLACPPDGECTSSWDEESEPKRQLASVLQKRAKEKCKKEKTED